MISEKKCLQKIEKDISHKREELHRLVKKNQGVNYEVIQKSRELDRLINKYYLYCHE